MLYAVCTYLHHELVLLVRRENLILIVNKAYNFLGVKQQHEIYLYNMVHSKTSSLTYIGVHNVLCI